MSIVWEMPENKGKMSTLREIIIHDKGTFHLPRQDIIKWLERSEIGLLNIL